MPDQPPPQSTDEALIRILRELGTIRSEFGAFKDHGDRRHLMLVNELAEVRIEAKRAAELAADAKRLADTAAHEMHDTQRAVIEHTRGLVDRQEAMEAAMESASEKLDKVLAADVDRRTREDEREKQSEARWKTLARWTPLVLTAASLVGYLLGHWKP